MELPSDESEEEELGEQAEATNLARICLQKLRINLALSRFTTFSPKKAIVNDWKMKMMTTGFCRGMLG